MFVTDVNDVKIYNLSAGKSLPEWLSEEKRRSLLKKDVELRKKIELIQDFQMPGVSTAIKVSKDAQYIIATGTYKPRVRCYDVNQLSMKFERCFDSEPVAFETLSDDYTKLVFMHNDRYVEFHSAPGRHYRLRIPKFGRDLVYHPPTCDLVLVGDSSEAYRLNLERGQFLQPFQTEASGVNCARVSSEHNLLVLGTQDGTVEAWDPRSRTRCGILDVALKLKSKELPSVTSVCFKNGLTMGVGTKSGHVAIYDLRASEPLLVKDHLNRLPIKRIEFNPVNEVVCSLDSSMLKIWDENSGKQKAYIESTSDFNDFATIPGTGMFFIAQESVKMLTYYIPSLGLAPKWCSFLDNVTEELETETVQNIYDDYKFVTRQELEQLGLDHLEGTNLLRGYMHGFFINYRLYDKAKAVVDPFAYERYRREKIREQLEAKPRLQVQSDLPKVNKDLARRFLGGEDDGAEKATVMKDDRFAAMFENPDFEIDKAAEEYRLLAPVLNNLEKKRVQKEAVKKSKEAKESKEEDKPEEESDPNTSDDEDLFYNKSDSNESGGDSSDEDKSWLQDVKSEYKKIRREKKDEEDTPNDRIRVQEVDEEGFNLRKSLKMHKKNRSLGELVTKNTRAEVREISGVGHKEMTFSTEKKKNKAQLKREFEMKKHQEERKKVRRPITDLKLKKLKINTWRRK